MKQDVIPWINKCEVRQRYKGEHVPSPGLLQPLEIANVTWKHITMNFVEKLPISEGADNVLVVIDRLSKYGHLRHPFTT